MKNIKLLIALIAGLFVAHATYALEPTGATAYGSYTTGSGAGTGTLVVTGTNGTYTESNAVPSGSVTPVTAVQNVNSVFVLGLSAHVPAVHSSRVYVVIPTGCTGSLNYSVANSSGGNAYVTVGSTTYTGSGTLTLSPGTYGLYAYADILPPATQGAPQATINLSISLD